MWKFHKWFERHTLILLIGILVVEDEGIVARDVRMQLQGLGYNPVGHASLGEEAIAMAGALRPDLVLMDIHLGSGMDGITAAQEVRSRFQLPVVFLTAFPNDDVLARAKLTEPFGYIFKPFSDHELHTVLEMALYKHQAERKLQTSALKLQSLARRVLEVQEAEGVVAPFAAEMDKWFGTPAWAR